MTVLEVALAVGWFVTLAWWGADHMLKVCEIENLRDRVWRKQEELDECQHGK